MVNIYYAIAKFIMAMHNNSTCMGHDIEFFYIAS